MDESSNSYVEEESNIYFQFQAGLHKLSTGQLHYIFVEQHSISWSFRLN